MLDLWRPKSRRSNVQIMAEILKVSSLRDVGKTEISSNVNVTYPQMQRYLKRLMELRLLDAKFKENNQVSYQTTEKGKILLNQVESVQELLQKNKT